jgi:hypothetical protein
MFLRDSSFGEDFLVNTGAAVSVLPRQRETSLEGPIG